MNFLWIKISLKMKILNIIKNLISINSFKKNGVTKSVKIIEKNIPEINTNPLSALIRILRLNQLQAE